MVSVLLVVTSWDALGNTGMKTGWYLPEVAHPYHVFKKAGFEITICSPKGGKAPMDPGSYENFKGDKVCMEFLEDNVAQGKLNNSIPASEIDPTQFKIVFFAGGHGPMWDFPDDKNLQQICTKVYESNGLLAGVCHGVVGLLNVKLSNGDYLVKGKEITCFTNSEETEIQLTEVVPFALETELVQRGCVFKAAANWAANVASSDRVITGQNPASGNPMAELIVEKAKELKL